MRKIFILPGKKRCPVCKGRKRVMTAYLREMSCAACNGRGWRKKRK